MNEDTETTPTGYGSLPVLGDELPDPVRDELLAEIINSD